MSRGSYEHMLKVMDKKPHLREILDNIDKYSDEDIESNPSIPGWMKKHLKRTSSINEAKESLLRATEIANLMDSKALKLGKPIYKCHVYKGVDCVVSGFEVKEGDTIAEISMDIIKVGNHCVKVSAADKNTLLKSSKYEGNMDIYDYGRFVIQELEKRHLMVMPSGRDYSMAGIMSSVKFG